MIMKLTIPGKMQLKMLRRDTVFTIQKSEIYYIGGAEVLPAPLEPLEENQVIGNLEPNRRKRPNQS